MSIGNPLKGDDNVANAVLDLLHTDFKKIRAETVPENFFPELRSAEKIIILDAIEFGAAPGAVRIFDLDELEDVKISTHSVPISFLRKFTSAKIEVIGIQPTKIEFGEMRLRKKIPAIAEKIGKIISAL